MAEAGRPVSWARLRLALALLAFLGWVGYLAWLTRGARSVVVSRSQVAAADHLVVARLRAGPDGRPAPEATVREVLARGGDSAPAEGPLRVANLPEARGFAGEGDYLLPLSGAGGRYLLTPPPRSPGYEAPQRPWVYPWTESVREQLRHLRPG